MWGYSPGWHPKRCSGWCGIYTRCSIGQGNNSLLSYNPEKHCQCLAVQSNLVASAPCELRNHTHSDGLFMLCVLLTAACAFGYSEMMNCAVCIFSGVHATTWTYVWYLCCALISLCLDLWVFFLSFWCALYGTVWPRACIVLIQLLHAWGHNVPYKIIRSMASNAHHERCVPLCALKLGRGNPCAPADPPTNTHIHVIILVYIRYRWVHCCWWSSLWLESNMHKLSGVIHMQL